MIGHLAALLTIGIWGTTFISTKILLVDFQPIEILFFRFVIGFLALLVISPKRLKTKNRKEEGTFALAGLCGLLFMIPVLLFFDFHLGLPRFAEEKYLFNILYLGLGASALCFVTWNFAVKELGAVKTSVYIYMVPVITVFASALFLQEKLTLRAGIGTVLILTGLFLSEYKPERKDAKHGPTK